MIIKNTGGEKMFSGFLKFDTLPQIGFAHHFYTEQYHYTYRSHKKSFEIVYVNSGGIEAELYGEKIYANEGSVFVLFRHLPIQVASVSGKPQSHCTVQVEFDYDFTLLTDDTVPESSGMLLPFVTPACTETEQIKRELYSIVSDMGISRDENSFSCSLKFLDLMRRLDALARHKHTEKSDSASIISYKVKKYITRNIEKSITLSEIADVIDKTPNYINSAFKEANGITINQYISREKITIIAALMQKQGLSFKTACDNVGISDTSYGYRLFKKHMGITPGEFLSGDIHK